MKAQNLTISVPNFGCDKNCSYCISKITGDIPIDFAVMERNFSKVMEIAKLAKVTDILITGKGEPFQSPFLIKVLDLAKAFNLPIEIQTNGLYLYKMYKDPHILNAFTARIDTFAFSMDKVDTMLHFQALFNALKREGKTVRICINLTDRINYLINFHKMLKVLNKLSIDQLLVRNVTYPDDVSKDNEVVKWIDKNTTPGRCEAWEKECAENYRIVRVLPLGAPIYDVNGVAVTFSNYCIQEDNEDDNIRSLIFQEDGHLYTTWNSMASRLF